MIDLVLWGATKGVFRSFAIANRLLIDDGEGGYKARTGLEYVWWLESGDMKTSNGAYDDSGDMITPPSYAAGKWALLRIHSDFFDSDNLTPDPSAPDRDEAWARSKVARYIKNNGVKKTKAGITYYELDGVGVFTYRSVMTKLESLGVSGHAFA